VLNMDSPDCPFLRGTLCRVYPVRPTQCRTFPFWAENLASRASWSGLCEFCPGVGAGPRHDLPSIRRHLRERGET
jgi:Fe-S-cluster containining protein